MLISSGLENMYSLGDVKNHPKWSTREINKVNGGGEDVVIDLIFSSLGTKTLMLNSAPIQKA